MLNVHRDAARISIGLSAAIPRDLDEDGLTKSELEAFVRAFAVELLRAGAHLVHGSHPTVVPLLSEAASVVRGEGGVVPRVTLVLSRARGHYNTPEKVAGLRAANTYAHVVEVPPAGEAVPSPEETLLRMRRDELVPRSRALVCVGGELHLKDGIRPGVEEEAALAEAAGRPVYLLAAGGGYTRRFFQARAGRSGAAYNGLTLAQNERLGVTLDAHEAASLVVRGLQVILGGRALPGPRPADEAGSLETMSRTRSLDALPGAPAQVEVKLAGRGVRFREAAPADVLRGEPAARGLEVERDPGAADDFAALLGITEAQELELAASQAESSRSVGPESELPELSLVRGGDAGPDEVVELEWVDEDGAVLREWVAASELPARFGEAARGGPGALIVPTRLMLQDTSRGLKEVVLRAARSIKMAWGGARAAIVEKLKSELGSALWERLSKRPVDALSLAVVRQLEDRLIQAPGLRTVADVAGGVELRPFTPPAGGRPLLVLIHGTASNTLGGFAGLWASEAGRPFWSSLRERFGPDGIAAFEHCTLSQSPARNALDLARALPSETSLHVLTHSRGGLVGELLCLDPGAESTVAGLAEHAFKGDHAQYAKDVTELLAELGRKELRIERFVRVACPAAGTTLASQRLDRYLGGLLNVLSLATGSKVVVPFVKSVLLAVVGARTKPEVLPGLEAMIPGSSLVRFVAAQPAQVGEGVLAVAGDFEGEGVLSRLKGLFFDLYYLQANDFVVDTGSMGKGIPRARMQTLQDSGPTTDHFSYFVNPSTLQPIHAVLAEAKLPIVGGSTPPPPGRRGLVLPLGAPPEPPGEPGAARRGGSIQLQVCVENRALETRSCRPAGSALSAPHYPLVVGFFVRALLMGPAEVVDELLGGELTRHLQLDLLPRELGTSRVFDGAGSLPEGAIVVGLGEGRDLSRARLTHAIEQALRAYAGDRLRDWVPRGEPISLALDALLLGQSFLGDLSVRDTVRALVQGMQRANRALAAAGQVERVRFEGLRIVERDECLARAAERELSLLARSSCNGESVELVPPSLCTTTPSAGYDGSNRLGRISRVQVEATKDEVRFDVLSNLARAERVVRPVQRHLLDLLLADAILRSREGATRALFQYLVPVELADGVSADTLLVLDGESAGLPWELLCVPGQPGPPLATEYGLVRQLRTTEGRRDPRRSAVDRVLVIGEPAGVSPPLPHALREARQVGTLLGQEYGFQVTLSVGADASTLLATLYQNEYDIIHVAAHGAPKDGAARAGILIGRDQRLTSVELNQLCAVPSLVFLNCCHLAPRPGGSVQDQGRIAADLAQDLIQIGVRVVVAAGWAVNDHAAATFADTLYRRLLSGCILMDAVRDARAVTRDRHPHGNTWGAYQVYGDPGFVFTARQAATMTVVGNTP